jgi:hypothetical protein
MLPSTIKERICGVYESYRIDASADVASLKLFVILLFVLNCIVALRAMRDM